MINWPSDLVESVARRRAVLVIGSGVSSNAKDAAGRSPPTWAEFLERAAARLDQRPRELTAALRKGRYLIACEFIKRRLGAAWRNVLRDEFSIPKYAPADIHGAIFDLDVRFVLSLNFDKIYDNYAIKNSESTYIIKNYHDDDVAHILQGSDRYIIKLHGSIDAPDKLIFTLKDYAHARTEHASFYRMLDALLLTHTMVMIGCGLEDPDMQIVFENYRYLFNDRRHYMITSDKMDSESKAIYEETRGLTMVQYKLKKSRDHSNLVDSLKALKIKVDEYRAVIADEMSW